MRVFLGKADEEGCGHYRIKFPAAAARARGFDAEVVTDGPLLTVDQLTHRVLDVEAPDCDVFVVQRPLRGETLQWIPHVQRKGVAVVVDIDDDFRCVDPAHMGWRNYQPHLNKFSNSHNLGEACRIADWVTCTTTALAHRYGSHGRVSVLPNFVPAYYQTIELPDRMPGKVIGWPGFVGVHPNDLQATAGGVAAAVNELGAKFRNIGDGERVAENLGLEHISSTGPVAFDEYPSQIAKLDVGIVPLAESKFNAAKSRLKGLELAAMGVPFIASRVSDYEILEMLGVGVTVKPRARNWRSAVIRMAGEEGRELGAEWRRKVFERFTYEHNADLWMDAWQRAAERRAQLSPKTAHLSG